MDIILNIEEATPEEIRGVQLKSLEILLYFDRFCRECGIRYYLCGGALIGALRDGRLIPWDDDIDVFMLREDYERLGKAFRAYADTNRYALLRSGRYVNYHHTDMALVDLGTTLISTHSEHEDIVHAIGIDIIPLDGSAPGLLSRMRQSVRAMAYCLYNAQRPADHQGALIRAASKAANAITPPAIAKKVWRNAQKKMSSYPAKSSKFLRELVTGLRYLKLRYPAEIFGQGREVELEGYRFMAPAKAEEYLKMAFGNYLELPPEKDRKPKHRTVYYSPTEPYWQFRGIYYMRSGGGKK